MQQPLIYLYRTYRSAKAKDQGELRKHAQILVVSESIGIIIPLAYLACLVVVYDGPNAINLGEYFIIRCAILRASTKMIVLKGWYEYSGRIAAGWRASTRGASSMVLPGASTPTNSSPLSGCTGGSNSTLGASMSHCM